MKIYISHSRDFDFENELYKPIRESSINNSYTFFFPHENQKDIDNIETLKSSNLIIAEVSFSSTGQGIELGIASTLNIPILCIYKEGSRVSKSLEYITDKFIIYSNSQDLVSKILDYLSK
ncbi:MAG: hypothetical protein WCW04_02045 [Candidatus Paceibacterota bacterium]